MPVAHQQIALQALACLANIEAGCVPGPYEVSHGFMYRLGHPDRHQVARTEKPGEVQGVAIVVLDVAWRRGDLGWRDDDAGQARSRDLAIEVVRARTGFVGAFDRAMLLLELAQQRDHS